MVVVVVRYDSVKFPQDWDDARRIGRLSISSALVVTDNTAWFGLWYVVFRDDVDGLARRAFYVLAGRLATVAFRLESCSFGPQMTLHWTGLGLYFVLFSFFLFLRRGGPPQKKRKHDDHDALLVNFRRTRMPRM